MINFKLFSGEKTVISGSLDPATTAHGHRIHEKKSFFNGEIDYQSPRMIVINNGDAILIDLKLTAKGFMGTIVRGGKKYGCNLNRVINKSGRWGITAWCEEIRAGVA